MLLMTRLSALVFFLTILLSATPLSAKVSLDKPNSQRLFSIQGSNTIGAHMAPSWVMGFLAGNSVTGLAIEDTGIDGESHVVGLLDGEPVHVSIAAHGSSTGFEHLEKGDADIAMSSRPIKDGEVQSLVHMGPMRSAKAENVVAIDGLAIIVNPSNPVAQLTVDQLKQIFSGEIVNWKSLGGIDQSIMVYARDDNSGTWDTFKSLILTQGRSLTSRALRFESNDYLASFVANDPSGIGFVAMSAINNVKAVAVSDHNSQPLLPKPLYVATEDYSLSRRLFMYVSPKQVNPMVADFVEYVQSYEGQDQVDNFGFISQNPMSLISDEVGDGPLEYLSLMQNSQRLSVNFRFDQNSTTLDNKAQKDIGRIARFMRRPENNNKKLQLVGFGDVKSNQNRSVVLSKLRATAVKSALHRAGVTTERVIGFGSFLPVAANGVLGHLKNQRVELWLKQY